MLYHVDYQNSDIMLLAQEEILNPFVIFGETFDDLSSPTPVQDELYEILTLVTRINYWQTYESPLIVYQKYKKIMRLVEAAWLIWQLRADKPLTAQQDRFYNSISHSRIEWGKSTKETADITIDPILSAYTYMDVFFRSRKVAWLRIDFHAILFQGLMPGCQEYDFELDSYFIDIVQELSGLIQALYQIFKAEEERVLTAKEMTLLNDQLKSCPIRLTDYDYKADFQILMSRVDQKIMLNRLCHFRTILSTSNFWKLHGNPANAIYYFDDFLFILDHYYLLYYELLTQGFDFDVKIALPFWGDSAIIRSTGKRTKKPWKYLQKQFTRKAYDQWVEELMSCMEQVLSNEKLDKNCAMQYDEVLKFLDFLCVFHYILADSSQTSSA